MTLCAIRYTYTQELHSACAYRVRLGGSGSCSVSELEEFQQLGCIHGEEGGVLLGDDSVGNVQLEPLQAGENMVAQM